MATEDLILSYIRADFTYNGIADILSSRMQYHHDLWSYKRS